MWTIRDARSVGPAGGLRPRRFPLPGPSHRIGRWIEIVEAQPPAMAPTTMERLVAARPRRAGRTASGDSWERSSSQAKKRMNGRRRLRGRVADGAAQHRVGRLEGVEDAALGGSPSTSSAHLAAGPRQGPEVVREDDADHGSVWTSTESTRGRSRTIGAQ